MEIKDIIKGLLFIEGMGLMVIVFFNIIFLLGGSVFPSIIYLYVGITLFICYLVAIIILLLFD